MKVKMIVAFVLGVCLIFWVTFVPKPADGASHSTLRLGASGYEVQQVQFILVSFGYVLPIDGNYGLKTVKAVTHFQEASDLTADGVVGSETWKVLDTYIYTPKPTIQQNPGTQIAGSGPEAARTALRAAGVDSETINWAVSVCVRESHCSLSAHNYNPNTRDDSWGPWQINYYGLSSRNLTIGPKESNVSNWSSAVANFLKLYHATGRCPWQAPNYCG